MATWRNRIHLVGAIVLPFVFLGAPLYVAWFLVTGASCEYTQFVYRNYLIFFGMPYAALFAYYLVVTLEKARGPVDVDFVGFKFKGAGGSLLFWILVFLAVMTGFKLLWAEPLPYVCLPSS